MKTIQELRTVLNFHPEEINSSVRYFAEHCDIDYDVFLPSKRINLQRDFIWTIDQKRELIWSILMKRHIPRMAMILTSDEVYEVVDGKQRLSTMIDFYKGVFSLMIDEKEYYFKDLPVDYQRTIGGYNFAYYIVNELENKLSDEDKISWFKFINFAGTPQDAKHIANLSNS